MREREVYEYQVVRYEDTIGNNNTGESLLRERVNHLLKHGWQPIGGVSCSGEFYKSFEKPFQTWAQALVKYR